uniref:Uncharacterized protein n=1 Tax=Chromera velia CCMP2878 TaxID=1169474 RepID=A0A0G4G7E9_9ALVE|eukprot:Cvel_20581.t1-p1 / transcript=Cvel_20581.t1 / gene=Cvel_20581 / organism=Chromera_velia_CCMP2878 / gene_product=hypothetical protein / transcript_product=hypothetical protein / location=Cvel_scaffold1859:15231-15686(+) / protein_length=152 / sequence_SO=supercontig / SO=protein_coding / is_pseudo=false
MSKDGKYGGEVELRALVYHFEVRIEIWDLNSDGVLRPTFIKPSREDRDTEETTWRLLRRGQHYDHLTVCGKGSAAKPADASRSLVRTGQEMRPVIEGIFDQEDVPEEGHDGRQEEGMKGQIAEDSQEPQKKSAPAKRAQSVSKSNLKGQKRN